MGLLAFSDAIAAVVGRRCLAACVGGGRKGEVEAASDDFVMGGKFSRVSLPSSESPEKRGLDFPVRTSACSASPLELELLALALVISLR